jgi:TonB family protein
MPFANRHCTRALITITLVLSVAIPSQCSVDKDREAAAARLTQVIEQLQLHKIYVSDFLDSAGARTEKGCYFASVFSSNLTKQAKDFEVLNRITVQKLLDTAAISSGDIEKPETLSKIASTTGADAILFGVITFEKALISLDLSLREASTGKEIHRAQYQEHNSPDFEGSFPAASDTSGHVFYFSGLDGVSVPKCIYCPQPNYSPAARNRKVNGTLLISAHVSERGAVDDVRIIRSLDPDLDEAALRIIRTWKLQPARDLGGTVVPLYVPVEITFHLK